VGCVSGRFVKASFSAQELHKTGTVSYGINMNLVIRHRQGARCIGLSL